VIAGGAPPCLSLLQADRENDAGNG